MSVIAQLMSAQGYEGPQQWETRNPLRFFEIIEHASGAYDAVTCFLGQGTSRTLLINDQPVQTTIILSPDTFGCCYLRLVPPSLYQHMFAWFGWLPFWKVIQEQFDLFSRTVPDHLVQDLQVHLDTQGLTITDKGFDTLHIALGAFSTFQQQLETFTPIEILQINLPNNMQVGADFSLQATDEFVIHGFTMRVCHCTKVILDANHFERHIRKGCPSFPLLTDRLDFGVSEPLILDTTITPHLHRQLDEVPHIPARLERSLPINFSYDQWPPHRLPAPYVPVDITDWHLDFVAICCTELPAQPPNFKPRDYPAGSVIYVDWFRGVVAIPVELSTYPDLSRATSAYTIT